MEYTEFYASSNINSSIFVPIEIYILFLQCSLNCSLPWEWWCQSRENRLLLRRSLRMNLFIYTSGSRWNMSLIKGTFLNTFQFSHRLLLHLKLSMNFKYGHKTCRCIDMNASLRVFYLPWMVLQFGSLISSNCEVIFKSVQQWKVCVYLLYLNVYSKNLFLLHSELCVLHEK